VCKEGRKNLPSPDTPWKIPRKLNKPAAKLRKQKENTNTLCQRAEKSTALLKQRRNNAKLIAVVAGDCPCVLGDVCYPYTRHEVFPAPHGRYVL
jgi:hypothetical protein